MVDINLVKQCLYIEPKEISKYVYKGAHGNFIVMKNWKESKCLSKRD